MKKKLQKVIKVPVHQIPEEVDKQNTDGYLLTFIHDSPRSTIHVNPNVDDVDLVFTLAEKVIILPAPDLLEN